MRQELQNVITPLLLNVFTSNFLHIMHTYICIQKHKNISFNASDRDKNHTCMNISISWYFGTGVPIKGHIIKMKLFTQIANIGVREASLTSQPGAYEIVP